MGDWPGDSVRKIHMIHSMLAVRMAKAVMTACD